jgi:hypothetical protein
MATSNGQSLTRERQKQTLESGRRSKEEELDMLDELRFVVVDTGPEGTFGLDSADRVWMLKRDGAGVPMGWVRVPMRRFG